MKRPTIKNAKQMSLRLKVLAFVYLFFASLCPSSYGLTTYTFSYQYRNGSILIGKMEAEVLGATGGGVVLLVERVYEIQFNDRGLGSINVRKHENDNFGVRSDLADSIVSTDGSEMDLRFNNGLFLFWFDERVVANSDTIAQIDEVFEPDRWSLVPLFDLPGNESYRQWLSKKGYILTHNPYDDLNGDGYANVFHYLWNQPLDGSIPGSSSQLVPNMDFNVLANRPAYMIKIPATLPGGATVTIEGSEDGIEWRTLATKEGESWEYFFPVLLQTFSPVDGLQTVAVGLDKTTKQAPVGLFRTRAVLDNGQPVPSDPSLTALFPLDSGGQASIGGFIPSLDEEVRYGQPGAKPATGQSAYFNGESSRIQFPWSPLLNPESFTLTVWAKSQGGVGSWNAVVASRNEVGVNDENSQGFSIYDGSLSGSWRFHTANGPESGTWQDLVGPLVNLGEWDHIAVTYDNASKRKQLFVNGDLWGTQTAHIEPNAATPFTIGAGREGGNDYWFSGWIDELGIWNRVLTVEEIRSVMNGSVK